MRVLAPGAAPAEREDTARPLETVRFTELYAQVLARDPADRVGLPGVQDKVSGRMIALPLRHRGDRWILELDPPEFPHLVANEAFFLAAARVSGPQVAGHERAQGEWRVTPAYDLPSSHPYGGHSMGLTIAGKGREDIGRADLIRFGEAVGVRAGATAAVIDGVLAAMPRWTAGLESLPFDRRRISKLRAAIEHRAGRLAP